MFIRRITNIKLKKFINKKIILDIYIFAAVFVSCMTPMPYPRSDIPPREWKRRQQTEKKQDDLVNRFAEAIKPFLDAPYLWGGDTPYGTDCSGLIMALYAQAADISLPHSTAQMFKMGYPVQKKNVKFADLLFFNTKGGGVRPSHVGLYLSKGIFLHASVSRGVALDSMSESPYKHQLIGIRRILAD